MTNCASVAQGIEHRSPKAGVVRSNRIGGTIINHRVVSFACFSIRRYDMKILTLPNPILHQVCEPVKVGDSQVKKLAKQMAKLMYKSGGVGLAAPQVGILKRLVVIDCNYFLEDEESNSQKKNPLVLINPEIVDHSKDKFINSEGCLSVPGISVDIERWTSVVVKCLNENFEEVVYEASEDLFCRCLQHELDHLDGNTLIERLNPVARIKAMQAYEQACELGARPGDV